MDTSSDNKSDQANITGATITYDATNAPDTQKENSTSQGVTQNTSNDQI